MKIVEHTNSFMEGEYIAKIKLIVDNKNIEQKRIALAINYHDTIYI